MKCNKSATIYIQLNYSKTKKAFNSFHPNIYETHKEHIAHWNSLLAQRKRYYIHSSVKIWTSPLQAIRGVSSTTQPLGSKMKVLIYRMKFKIKM